MFQLRSSTRACVLAAPLVAAGTFLAAQTNRLMPGLQPDGSYRVSTNQSLTPVGTLRKLERTRPKDLAVSPDGKRVAVLCTTRLELFGIDGKPEATVALKPGAMGVVWAPDGRSLYTSGEGSRIYHLEEAGGAWTAKAFPVEAETFPASAARKKLEAQVNGLAVSPDGKRLYAALGIRNEVGVFETESMTRVARVRVGVAPYSVVLSPDGRTLYVSNRGGREATPGAAHSEPSGGTQVRVDPETDAAEPGSLSFIDTESYTAVEVPVGRQPAGMAISKDGRRLYVANCDEDTVSVVDTRDRTVERSIPLEPPQDLGFGRLPTSVALSPDEKTLFVSCGGENAVAVVSLADRDRIRGYLPTGWFPIALALRGDRLIVASTKGIGARPENANGRYKVHDSVGTVQFIEDPIRADLMTLTRRVAANNRWGGEEGTPRRHALPVPVPARVGEPSVFHHVVYILKENHTYDQDLGDIPEGNGDRSLTLFGEEVTPNEHALARQFVLLDNTYTSGTNSADGHQWTDSAIANGYMEQNYAAHSRSYPYDGGDALSASPRGFLWNAARKKGLSVRVFGEFVNRPKVIDPKTGKQPRWKEFWDDAQSGEHKMQVTAVTDTAALRPLLHPNYVGWPIVVNDQYRAGLFLNELKEWEAAGKMPALSMMLLPCNHTEGSNPGMPRPRSMVADNDLALGRIIEGISHSRFWKDTLVMVIEDDSQSAVDHVDGHRTVAFCVSPYTRRQTVVSAEYNHTSFLRTIELVLGLPPMTRFDRTATPLTECFTDRPDFTPYDHRANNVRLDDLNPPAHALRGEAQRLAIACMGLDWSGIDRADPNVVARAIWQSVKGTRPFPVALFHPVKDEDDD